MRPSLLIFLTIMCLSCTWADEEEKEEEGFKPKFPKNIADSKTYKKFIELVEENKLNITVVLSHAENFNNRRLKNRVALSVTFPTNAELATEADEKNVEEWLKVAEAERLPAARTKQTPSGTVTTTSNNERDLVQPAALGIERSPKNGKTGIQTDEEENVAAQYTFKTPDDTITKVLFARGNVTLEEHSGLTPEEISGIKRILAMSFLMYDENVVPQAVVSALDRIIPKSNWQFVDNADQLGYLDSKKYGVFGLGDYKYGIFSIE